MLKTLSCKLFALGALFCAPLLLSAQTNKTPLPNWQNLDLKINGMFGISTEKAYQELLKDKPHKTVLVAVIDGGVDINHEDLKSIIWNNPSETAGNGTDDDKNGYIDDLHGWNFIGGAKGDVHYDNLELTRQLRDGMAKYKYARIDTLSAASLTKYNAYQKMDKELNRKIEEAQKNLSGTMAFANIMETVYREIGKENPSYQDFQAFTARTEGELYVRKIILENWKEGGYKQFKEDEVDAAITQFKEQLNYHFNMEFDSRDTVADNYNNASERLYGNNNVMGPDADHGTHVSGIIGAVRDNDLGIKGVANDVMIMSVRTVPNGDERDKDVANAIRYAAANGARVINMSFGKEYSYNKQAVDDAVKFAMSKDVLIVHAAGNDNKDLDTARNFPNRIYADKSGTANGWIEVGASGFNNDETLKASFSNYGKTSVDVFAPGVAIRSSVPGSKYKEHDGTSMAAPVVAGLAALIRSYYPALTAVQVKEIIMKSSVKPDRKVSLKVGKSNKKMPFADLCISGGIVNAYDALKLAGTY